jgi:chromate transporter
MQALFYGVGAAVVGIIAVSSYKLTEKSVGKINLASLRQNSLLWLFFIVAAIVTIYTQQESILLFIAAGVLFMFIKAPPAFKKRPYVSSAILLFGAGFWQFQPGVLMQIALFFLRRAHLYLAVGWLLCLSCIVVLSRSTNGLTKRSFWMP